MMKAHNLLRQICNVCLTRANNSGYIIFPICSNQIVRYFCSSKHLSLFYKSTFKRSQKLKEIEKRMGLDDANIEINGKANGKIWNRCIC